MRARWLAAALAAAALAAAGGCKSQSGTVNLTLVADASLSDATVAAIGVLDVRVSGAAATSQSYLVDQPFASGRQERLSIRTVCEHFGNLLGREPKFIGTESATALLNDAHLARHLLGPPPTSVEQMLEWTADWIKQGGETWNRPTHFEVRDGKF